MRHTNAIKTPLASLAIAAASIAGLASTTPSAHAGETTTITIPAPEIDVWVYPPGPGAFSPYAATFAAPFGTADPNRFGYFFAAFDLDAQVPADPRSFTLTELTFTVRLLNSSTFDPNDGVVYDPTLDPLATYTGAPDTDPGRPLELYAAEYLNGFDLDSWIAAGAPVGPSTNYNAQPIDLDPDGNPRNLFYSVDDGIEANPFAIGTTNQTYIGPGGTTRIADGATITFSIDLTAPNAEPFWRDQLATGRVAFIVSSLHAAGFSGMGGEQTYPRLGTDNSFGNYDATATITIGPPDTTEPCPGDLNDDSIVDSDDLGILLGAFGTTPAGDLDNDNDTDSDDLGILLSAFGTNCR
ncbi:MAG: hypothetical protein ACTS3F_00890 [Phycisphaerales bacterium]